MMWSVIIFENDNSIEAVPSVWYRKNTCAWPKKNQKKYIEKQVIPNKTDFYFLRARKIGKDVENYLDARNRAKKGENTSNLSDNVDESVKKRRKLKKIFSNKKDNCMWSPSTLTHSSSDDTDNDEVHMPNISSSVPSGIEKTSLGESSKRKLNFDESPPLIIHNYQSNNSQTNFNIMSEPIEFQSASVDNNIVVAADNTDVSQNVEDIVNNIIRTTASPFKVTNINDTTTIEITEPYIPLPLTPAGLQSFTSDSLIDKVNKINRTTLNTWYEIKSMNEKIEKLENNLFMISNNRMQLHIDDNSFESMNTFEVMMSVLPIVNEESLTTFENNLLDNNFKKKIVCELSRLVRSTIQSTTRAILRYLFDDSFLQSYSYKGQKQKKSIFNFSPLFSDF
ncbi:homeobox-like protein HDP1 [Rhopalosiphum padi]|uniref:homeobox-like protein HDP1 n=1 Tax=Rhopalosiphum padi TaxID=40932 RepID=UPI00298DA7BC|nr:homeobox-like protein HDP1 [Rhopalosiphum padi]XP_060845052.1 homeobox-like protein HDP1 [Rhopalosiphum padi]XP_060845053.1 homeobox-like protein HDP1 [Rhopalosiphum padi]XP_060845054.1 homeobox-like protein HDP1 [Rhopalosiphum padi]